MMQFMVENDALSHKELDELETLIRKKRRRETKEEKQ
jgi:hypothetical protein